jgi:hypothetical protein
MLAHYASINFTHQFFVQIIMKQQRRRHRGLGAVCVIVRVEVKERLAVCAFGVENRFKEVTIVFDEPGQVTRIRVTVKRNCFKVTHN